MANDKGMGFFTSGDYKTWIGQGKTELVATSNYSVTYGVKTSAFLGMSNDVTLGTKSTIFMGASFDAKKGDLFEISNADVLRVGKEGGFHYSDHHFAGVGSSRPQKLLIEQARSAAWLLVDIQMSLMVLMSAAALVFKVDEQQHKDQLEPHSSSDVFGYIASIATIIASLAAMLGILNKRFNRYCKTDTPVGILSMQSAATGSVFLGTRDPDGNSTAGVAMNDTGIDLSTSNTDLGYRKASTATIGFEDMPNADDIAGARLKLNAPGNIELWGKDLTLTLKDHAIHKAPMHTLQVDDDGNGGDGPKVFLRMDKDGAEIKADRDIGMMIDKDWGCGAQANDSSMMLTGESSSLSCGDGALALENREVKLALGNTEIKIDATGITLGGGAISIMAPGGGRAITASDLSKMKSRISRISKKMKTEEQKANAQQKKLKMLQQTTESLQQTLIRASAMTPDDQA